MCPPRVTNHRQILSMQVEARWDTVCLPICSKWCPVGFCRESLRIATTGSQNDSREFFSYRCYSSRDLRPVVSLAEKNSHLLDSWVLAFAMQLLHDCANLLLKLLLAAH